MNTNLSNPSDALGAVSPFVVEPGPSGPVGDVESVAGVADGRCPTCSALLDVNGRCWWCAARCDRCAGRGDLVVVADSEGSSADVCVDCAGEWLRAVVEDFTAPLGVFTGRASEAEAAEHARAVAERAAAEEAAAQRKADQAAARLRKLAEQVDAVVAVVQAADRPLRKAEARAAAPFGVNAAERALATAVRDGRLRTTAKGYVPIDTTNNPEQEAA
jgi:hypothetical protein